MANSTETAFRLLEPWLLKFIFDEIIFKEFQVESLRVPVLDNLSVIGLLSLQAVALVAIASGEPIVDLLEIVPEVQDWRDAYPAPPFYGKLELAMLLLATNQVKRSSTAFL